MKIVHNSDSSEQRGAEKYIAEQAEQEFKCRLERNPTLRLANGVQIEPDLYSEEQNIVCEVYAHIGTLKAGQQHKVSQDILKMLLLEKEFGKPYKKYILVVDEQVKAYLKGQSFLAESLRQFEIGVKIFYLPDNIRQSVIDAQKRQYR